MSITLSVSTEADEESSQIEADESTFEDYEEFEKKTIMQFWLEIKNNDKSEHEQTS